MPQSLTFEFAATGERLDQALAQQHPDLSRVQWQTLIKESGVTLNGRILTKPSHRLNSDSIITATIPDPVETALIPENIPLDIVYEDDDMLIINKPAGLVVHPAPGHETGTLVNAVLAHCPDILQISGEKRPGIVHRLDKDTSGLIVVAKNDIALRYLQKQFKKRTVVKKYIALTEGKINPPKGLIDAPIGRDPKQRKRMAVISSSKATSRPAQTEYEMQKQWGRHSLVECLLHTGRTHQIRVHLAFLGYPLVGDAVYGRKRQNLLTDRHFLHASYLELKRPSDEETISFTSPLPPELNQILESLEEVVLPNNTD